MPPDRKAEARSRSRRATTRTPRPSRAQPQARQAVCLFPGAGMNLASSDRGGTHGHFRPTQRWRIRRASHPRSLPSPSRGCVAECVPTTSSATIRTPRDVIASTERGMTSYLQRVRVHRRVSRAPSGWRHILRDTAQLALCQAKDNIPSPMSVDKAPRKSGRGAGGATRLYASNRSGT